MQGRYWHLAMAAVAMIGAWVVGTATSETCHAAENDAADQPSGTATGTRMTFEAVLWTM